MIKQTTSLSLAEAREYFGSAENPAVQDYFKAFTKLSAKDAKKLAENLRKLNNLKIREHHIVKILDFLPKDSEDVNKIFTDVSLSEEEINAITKIVSEY